MCARWLATLVTFLASAANAAEVSFAIDVAPLLKSRCVMCHLPGAEQGGLALHPKGAYKNLVGVPSTQSPLLRVAPGKPEESYLYRKLMGTHLAAGGTGERMPFGDMQLTSEEIERVKRWIETGARP
jgi:hypothetical protein